MNTKMIAAILGLILSAAAVLGLVFKIDDRWLKAEAAQQFQQAIQKLEIRLNVKIMQDRADDLQRRMWQLEDRYNGVGGMPAGVRDEYRHLQQERNQLLDQISRMGR